MNQMDDHELIEQLRPFIKEKLDEAQQVEWQELIRTALAGTGLRAEKEWQRAFFAWLEIESESPESTSLLPEPFRASFAFNKWMVPILIRSNHAILPQLLHDYFSFSYLAIPHSWDNMLLLIPEESIAGKGRKISRREQADVVCGLHALFENEGLAGVLLATTDPVDPFLQLPLAWRRLKHTMRAGSMFAKREYVYLSWSLELERLVSTIPADRQRQWLGDTFYPQPLNLDEEMRTTLQHYFFHQCNLRDTANALHVHRNTLVYRLDKFKQETGRDVRSFGDALLIRLSLLLEQTQHSSNHHSSK